MKNIKTSLLIVGLIAGSNVFAATTLPDGSQSNAGKYTYEADATAPKYVVSNFDFMASAYVVMAVDESSHAIAVGSTSLRGLQNVFTGSSEGGSVTVCGTPTGSGASFADKAAADAALGGTDGVDVEKVGGCASADAVNP